MSFFVKEHKNIVYISEALFCFNGFTFAALPHTFLILSAGFSCFLSVAHFRRNKLDSRVYQQTLPAKSAR
jgi:hypothetical protein